MTDAARKFRFADFELDLSSYELSRQGRKVPIERQPMDLLVLLLESRGRLVTRDDIIQRLWTKDVFIDFDTGVNTAVRKVRQALRDTTARPKFIETVVGKGYRFIAPVVLPTSGVRASKPVRLAVLPFEILCSSKEREYLADGLTEELTSSLGHIGLDRLCVIGRTSTMTYKHSHKSLAAVGQELQVDYLVEGSIREESGRLRITVKLILARDQVQVWSHSYDRSPTSTLGLQQELSSSIARQIDLNLSQERVAGLARRQTLNLEAYDLYLRGRRLWHQLTGPTTRAAVEHFTHAVELDPAYGLAWAGIAEAHASGPINADVSPLVAWRLARQAADRALQANAELAEAHHAVGQVNFFFEWDWSAAEQSYRRAVALNSDSAFSLCMLGHVLSQMGRHPEAKEAIDRALVVEPFSALVHSMASQVAFQANDFAAALAAARRAVVLDPMFWVGHMMAGQAQERCGEHILALDSLLTAVRLSDGNSKPTALRGYLLARQQRKSEAREVLALMQQAASNRYYPPYASALVHAGLDDPDAALDWLERAREARDVHLIFLTADPKWDSFSRLPRFQALVTACNFQRTHGVVAAAH